MSSILDRLEVDARLAPQRVAILEDRRKGRFRSVTCEELWRMSQAFRASFEHSTMADSIIPLYLERSAACVAAILGAIGAHRGFVPINRKLRGPQLEGIVRLLDSPFLVSDARGVVNLKESLTAGSSLAGIGWRLISSVGSKNACDGVPQSLREVMDLAPLALDEFSISESACGEFKSASAACCLFTSGSTGEPKGVMIDRSDLHRRVAAEVDWFRLTKNDVLLNLLPFSFDVGLNQMLSAVYSGAQLVLLSSWMPVDIQRACVATGVTGISSVPGLWRDQIASGLVLRSGADGRDLRYVTISGGGLDRGSLERLPTIVPSAGIYKTYGQTETFRSSSLHPDEYPTKMESVGRAFGSAKFYVVDQNGERCPPNVEGEIIHTGMGVMKGYLGDKDSSAKLIENPFAGAADTSLQAIRTGDFGATDEGGYLFVRGRHDEMVKIQDNRVYPEEIAAQIVLLNAVVAAEVVPFKSALEAPRLAAFVCLERDSGIASEEIRAQLRSRLPSYMVPHLIVISQTYPKTSNGKTDRQSLVRQALELALASGESLPEEQ